MAIVRVTVTGMCSPDTTAFLKVVQSAIGNAGGNIFSGEAFARDCGIIYQEALMDLRISSRHDAVVFEANLEHDISTAIRVLLGANYSSIRFAIFVRVSPVSSSTIGYFNWTLAVSHEIGIAAKIGKVFENQKLSVNMESIRTHQSIGRILVAAFEPMNYPSETSARHFAEMKLNSCTRALLKVKGISILDATGRLVHPTTEYPLNGRTSADDKEPMDSPPADTTFRIDRETLLHPSEDIQERFSRIDFDQRL